ncbi:adhesion G-protein coupled receptor D2-like [Prorops nasuta]|uniref:adhesion G-protein coupled receptor D2-like n=1 Tax=Prorops nasuta TaxID=863751 RepID=UPI0034CD4423
MKRSIGAFIHVLLACWMLYSCTFVAADSLENAPPIIRSNRTPMHKVLLTQRGYIQFLRWELPVPKIKEFTFCLWIKSDNFTLDHSIFSYSKDEKDSLVRSWISDHGQSVRLEISRVKLFEQPVRMLENRWYHVCQSWESYHGRFALWIDGRVKVQGHAEETRGHTIPSGGDIVLGQEYTDFDKGLEEGIEGAVLGFNLLLASAFSPFDSSLVSEKSESNGSSRWERNASNSRHADPEGIRGAIGDPVIDKYLESLRALWISTENSDDSSRNSAIHLQEPLGLRLVKLSFVNCEIGRGSPYIGAKDLMLISWSRTPVKIFGGALLKNVYGKCGHF